MEEGGLGWVGWGLVYFGLGAAADALIAGQFQVRMLVGWDGHMGDVVLGQGVFLGHAGGGMGFKDEDVAWVDFGVKCEEPGQAGARFDHVDQCKGGFGEVVQDMGQGAPIGRAFGGCAFYIAIILVGFERAR